MTMKKLVSIIILCLGCMGILGAQDNIWKPINGTGILGIGPDGSIFAYNENGKLARSQDDGETWQIVLGQETGFTGHINSSCFAVSNEGRIFVINDNQQTVMYSDDNGDTWQQTTSFSPYCAFPTKTGICAPTNDIIVVWAEEGEINFTLDGGETWDGWVLELDEESQVGDMIVNAESDVYISAWSYSDGDAGIFHSTLSDMQNWELVAAEGINIMDLAFDSDGNVVACGWSTEGSIGFQHTPGFYLFDGTSLAIGDGGIVYTPHYSGLQAILSYSTDHGEHFTEIGEHLPLVDIAPGGENGCLFRGADNHLYFDNGGEYWKSVRDADHIINHDYFPLVHEGNGRQDWNVVYIITGSAYPDVYHTDIQSIHDDITLDDVDYRLVWTGNGLCESIVGAVREEGQRVFYRRYTADGYEDEVLLYDFNLTVGDTVTVNWGNTTLLVMEESEVEVDGTMRRQLGLGNPNDGVSPFSEVDEYWIEGVGSTHGFLNSGCEPWSWFGSFVHLLCYYENGNLIWDNEEFDECVMNSDGEPASFAPQGAEWYFDVFNPWNQHPEYTLFSVDGDTIIQGHQCSIITQHFVDTGHNGSEFVYEEDNKVYWFNPTTNAFTTLYDFNAEAGESWYYEVGECSHQVIVDSVGSVTWNGHTYRTQWVRYNDDLPAFRGKIIEGIGYERGLFPSIYDCNGWVVYDASEIEYLRCYVKYDEILYHEGDVDCDWEYVNTFCWDGTVAEAYAGGDGTEENPYQIANAQQLALLAQQTNNGTGGDAYYRLTANINLEKCTGGSIAWTSIGIPENDTTPRYFTGHFDGGGNNILNLYQRHDATFKGLFGCTDGAEIKNVNLVYCEIGNGAEYASGLVAYAGLTDISNCSVQNSNIITTGGVAGGIVGYAGMPFRVHETNENVSKITNCKIEFVTVESSVDAGGIVGKVNDDSYYARYLVSNCSANNGQYFHVKGSVSGGIVGEMRYGTIEGCASNTIVVGTGQVINVCVGGIAGSIHGSSVIANSYNRGNVVADFEFAGGIVGYSAGNVYNVYNAGEVVAQDPINYGFGTIVGNVQAGERLNCYWLENVLPSAGNLILPDMPGSTSFHQGSTPTSWTLNEPQYGTSDLLEALNLGPHDEFIWLEDVDLTNGGLPIPIYSGAGLPLHGSEWYYEILNDDGSITYQYMYQAGDTIVHDEPTQILVKINTLYDKGSHQEVTREYVYERDGKVYWWNKTLEEFTVLYDLGAQEGDEWEIKVGTETLTMHVDAVEQYEYEGRTYKILQVSDEGDIFSGIIVCGIGHLTSFFPERLLTRNKGYRVEGIRCYWREGELVFKYGDKDCDEVYQEYHNGLDESNENQFNIYPNPTKGILFVETRHGTSLSDQTYRITNLMGQNLLIGHITSETQQIDVTALPEGMYFITFTGETRKFMVR